MNLRHIIKSSQKAAIDNSPALLTAVGLAGLLTTAYLTGTASFKAASIIAEEEGKGGTAGDTKQRLKERSQLVWKLYIPAVTAGAFSCGAIVMANRIGTRRTAAMAAAFAVTERAYDEYREKVVETIGKNKEEKIRAEVAKNRVHHDLTKAGATIVIGTGNQLCHEAFTGRFFSGNMEALRRAETNINRQILHDNYATVTNFYNNIPGLEQTSTSDELGWNTDKFLELLFIPILVEDESSPYHGQVALSFDYAVVPIRDPWRFC